MKNRLPAMTATEATSFERTSQGSMIDCLNHYRCGCKPYEDIFTFRRWIAQGYVVKRGEKAYTLPLIKAVEIKDDDGNLVDWFNLPARSSVFCRCQVSPLKTGKASKQDQSLITQANEIARTALIAQMKADIQAPEVTSIDLNIPAPEVANIQLPF